MWPQAASRSPAGGGGGGGAGSAYPQHACVNGSDAVASGCVAFSAPGRPLVPSLESYPAAADGMYAVGESPFLLVSVHGVMDNGWVVWEDQKYVSVSKRRFASLATFPNSVEATVAGKPGEVVHLIALRPHGRRNIQRANSEQATAGSGWTVVTADVLVGANGVGMIKLT
jgi:hypothetical protein